MTETTPKESSWFRFIIGLLALGGALGGFFALFYVEIPARNENALLLALGFVMGWAGAVIASEYGATTVGRKVAESAVRNIERQNIASETKDEQPLGTEEDPLKTEIVGSDEKPVVVTEIKGKKP